MQPNAQSNYGTNTDLLGIPISYQQKYKGNYFLAALQSGFTSSAGPTAAVNIIGLNNPTGSGKNLILRSVQMALAAVPGSTVTFFHAVQPNPGAGAPSGVTPLTARACLLGDTRIAAVGIPCSAATLGAVPVIARVFKGAEAAGTVMESQFNDVVDGEIIIAPGTQWALECNAVTNGFASIVWEEVPIW